MKRTRRAARATLAMVIAGTIAFFGVVPAIADVITPTPTASETASEPEPSPPAPEPSVPEPEPPAPAPSQPAPELSEPAPEPEQSEPAPEPTKTDEAETPTPTPTPTGLPEAKTSDLSIGLMMVGPEAAGTPYMFWDLRTANNDSAPLVGGGAFELQGPRTGTGSGNWGTTYSVADCVAEPCSGYDRDPDAGEFQVVNGQGGFPSFTSSQRWRVRPNAAPATWSHAGAAYQFTSSTSTWTEITGTSGTSNTPAAGQWVTTGTAPNQVTRKDFGNFIAAAIPTTQDIVVRKRVFADPSAVGGSVSTNIGTNYANTVGAVFRLYENASDAPGAATGFTCTVAAGGECTITVTNVQNGGANYNKRYWVVEEAPVAGSPADATYSNPTLYVGSYQGPTEARRLVGLTQQVSASSSTQYLPMVNAGVTGGTVLTSSELPGSGAPSVAEGASFGAMVNSYKNPVIVPKCEVQPLRIALVLDQSASISGDQWTTFRNALVSGNDSVLGILRNAGSLVSILGFGTSVASPNGWHYGSGGPAALPANYSTLIPTTRPGGGENRTNWDAALSTIAGVNGTHQYDMVLFVTDGAPNYILNGTGVSGDDVGLRSLEAPMYAANALKVAGTRMVAVGVGNGASGSQVAANLRAVSGQVSNSDYIQGDWVKLKDILTDIVKAATCTLPIEVSKTTVAANGTTTTFAGNWQFTIAKSGDGNLSTPLSKTTSSGAAGTAKWDLTFSQPAGQTASVTLTETTQPNWSLTAVACTVAGQPYPVTIATGNSVTISGLTTTSEKVACTFTNTEAQFGRLAITKAFGTPMPPGNAPAGVTFSGAYTCATGPNTVAAGTWSRVGTGPATLTPTTPAGSAGTSQQVPAGASCTVTETAPSGGMPDPSWAWDTPSATSPVTIVNGQTGTVTVTNKAKRVYGNFRVTKHVPAGSVTDPANQYSGGWSCVLGGATVTGSWGPIAAGATWSSTDANLIPLGATCSVTTETRPALPVSDGSYEWDGPADLGGTVVAKAAPSLDTVTVTNRSHRVLGTVGWTKVDASTQTPLGGSEWNLATSPGGVTHTVTDCVTAPAACPSGPFTDQDPAAGRFLVVDLPWGGYTLTETKAPPGYLLDQTPHAFTIGQNSVDVVLGSFENTPVTPPNLPLTGGLSRDAYVIAGLGTLLIGLAAYGVLHFRTRRKQV